MDFLGLHKMQTDNFLNPEKENKYGHFLIRHFLPNNQLNLLKFNMFKLFNCLVCYIKKQIKYCWFIDQIYLFETYCT
jgi:hypothetical protein